VTLAVRGTCGFDYSRIAIPAEVVRRCDPDGVSSQVSAALLIVSRWRARTL